MSLEKVEKITERTQKARVKIGKNMEEQQEVQLVGVLVLFLEAHLGLWLHQVLEQQ